MKKLFLFLLVVLLFAQCSATTTKRSTGETIDDKVIVVKLRSKYINDKIVKSSQVKIKSWKGVVTLSGVMDDQTALNHAIEIAEEQNGVKEVKAYLVLKDSGVVLPATATTTTTTATTISTAAAPTVPIKSKEPSKKNKDREVIETDLMDNSVTTPLSDDSSKRSTDQTTKTNVKSKSQPIIESTTDFEEVKY